MSSIYGILTCSKTKKLSIQPMEKWNLAYGQDNRETLTEEGIQLGCCLEKLSEKAPQSSPVLNKNNKLAVIDALLYNREELLEQCNTKENLSDEELLFTYIELYGINALKNVNGDFAGAIYDKEENKLILFRDHIGVRPLFFYQNNSLVAFSTDLRGLTALPEVDVTISEEWIFKIVAGYSTIGTETTEFENIFCVAPAQYLTFSFSDDTIKKEKKQYWKLGSKKIRLSSDEEYQKKMCELITDSVNRRLNVISGPIGAELSGGLDSGVIDILISRAGREGVYFSWSSDPKDVPIAKDDERLVIQDICKQENIVCNYSGGDEYLDENSMFAESMKLAGLPLNMDQLPALRYALPPYINALTICETAQFVHRKGSKVVFTGHGGDEGVSHRCNAYELFYHKEYISYFRHFWRITKGQPRRIIRTFKHCVNNLKEAKKKFDHAFHKVDGVPELLSKAFAAKYRDEDMPYITFAYDPRTYIRAGATCNRLYNVSLLGAYCGARYIAPFVDYRVIDFAVSIPRNQFLKNNVKRYIYREAFKDILPESLYTLTIKESNSYNNVKADPNWFEAFAAKKKETVELLDRNFWSKYLNYDEIDAWLNRGEPSEEDRLRERSILTCLFYCAMIQNLVEKSRS